MKINYSLRPAKQIERRMICEALRRLESIAPLSSYRYVGFGSFYYKDFQMMHKDLGLQHLISLERDSARRDRYAFNKPYSCIDLQIGLSTNLLSALEWRDIRTILWLDYDTHISDITISDLNCFINNACPGSAFIVTINVHGFPEVEDPIEILRETLDTTIFPHDIDDSDFRGSRFASLCYRALCEQIDIALEKRNVTRGDGHKYRYEQVFNFRYKDGAKMLTIGGILLDDALIRNFGSCQFDNLSFIRFTDDPYQIKVPNLTQKEMMFLNSQLPASNATSILGNGIPESDIKSYLECYRYFPNFAEITG